MKFFISVFAALGILALTGCGPRHAAAEPSAAGTNVTEIVHVDPAGAAKLLETNHAVVVLDVRTPREFAAGHLKDGVNIDYNASDFRQKLAELDPNKTYLVHCAVGGRSTSALTAFEELGFKKVVHLDGGMKAWEKDGEPVVK
ncbi:MAG: rhodanese-like domain-containing protein [Verrucomicrobiae bacterium]|nr:rhodanese-like domain-containing protein [Verrucomicrobiae bacterium]MCP5524257.1 rhodanese-like domain-containing protein [Verrucomicrobiales bacterium]